MTTKAFHGANGWYLADEDAAGFHHQPATWDSAAWYPTRAAALQALADEDDDEGDEYWGASDDEE